MDDTKQDDGQQSKVDMQLVMALCLQSLLPHPWHHPLIAKHRVEARPSHRNKAMVIVMYF